MTSVLSQLPLSYAVLLEHRSYGSASAVHEPNPTGRPAAPRVRLHLKPGQKGTKQLLAQYGDRLICVRYRYDAQRKKRLKTVELLVAERDWQPRRRFADDQIVGLRVDFADVAVRAQVKQAGGRWNPERRVWQLRYDRVVALGLTSRIADESASTPRCAAPRSAHLPADA
jgi:hypothetical protein